MAEPGQPLPEPVAATALPQCAKGKCDDRVADTPGPDERRVCSEAVGALPLSRESDSGGPHPIGPLQPERAVSGRVEWRLSHLTGAHTGAHRAHTSRFAGEMPRNLRSRKPLWAISVHRGFESLPPPLT